MGTEAVGTSWYVRWRLGIVSLLSAMLVIGVVVTTMLLTHQTEPRLIGTWISDADRTIAEMLDESPEDEQRVAKLRNIFGKLRMTYTPTTYTTDFDGTVETRRYRVLGSDEHSAVIQLPKETTPGMEAFNLSSFLVVHFEGADSYWIDIQITGGREYFKRVK